MRIALISALLVISPGTALAAGPTPAQVQAAVSKAERSGQLWATINVCNTAQHPNALGIRGSMPALGFAASLTMRIQIEYYWHGHLTPDPGIRKIVRFGVVSTQVHQGGHTFQFRPRAALLTGSVTFSWWRNGQLIGRTTRLTTRGHHDADFGDPAGFSAARCRIA
jgi:hypothetical protein